MLAIVDCIWRKPMSTYAISVLHWWLQWIWWICLNYFLLPYLTK